ncbi:MAG: M48 family metalloprotease [Acidimicrobiia bacterium]|nr:M48 family metalloprotease [Acidimicrobiia bacterium]
MNSMRNALKTTVLLAALGGLLMAVGSFFGQGGLLIGFAFALLTVGGSYWFSDKLALRSAGAQEVAEAQFPQYYAIMRDLTQRAGIPMPRLYISPSPQPNAFATGRNPSHAAVCVNQGILDVLNWDELRGVLAHEISHVRNRDILIGSVAAAVAMVITFAARMAMWGALFGGGNRDDEGGNPLGYLAMVILAPIAAAMMQMALSRNREYAADSSGARLIGDGEPLARALEKLHAGVARVPDNVQPAQAQKYIANPLAGRKVMFGNLWTTHPPMQERVRRLREHAWVS